MSQGKKDGNKKNGKENSGKFNSKTIKHDPQAESARAVFGLKDTSATGKE